MLIKNKFSRFIVSVFCALLIYIFSVAIMFNNSYDDFNEFLENLILLSLFGFYVVMPILIFLTYISYRIFSPKKDTGNTRNSDYYLKVASEILNEYSLHFTTKFLNNKNQQLVIPKNAKWYMNIENVATEEKQQFFLYDVLGNNDETKMANTSYVSLAFKQYEYSDENNQVHSFPLDLKDGLYTFQSELKHSSFNSLKSNRITFDFPVKLITKFRTHKYYGKIGNITNIELSMRIEYDKATASFINYKTDKTIHIKGIYDYQSLNNSLILEEFDEENEKLKGTFHGKMASIGKEEKPVFYGNWISSDEQTTLPFEFIIE